MGCYAKARKLTYQKVDRWWKHAQHGL